MLKSPLKHTQFAYLKDQQFPLLEIFVLMFLNELEGLVKRGSRANYVSKEQNHVFLKGKLLFNERQIQSHVIRNKLMQIHFIFTQLKPSKISIRRFKASAKTQDILRRMRIFYYGEKFSKKQSFSTYQGNSKAFTLLFDVNAFLNFMPKMK